MGIILHCSSSFGSFARRLTLVVVVALHSQCQGGEFIEVGYAGLEGGFFGVILRRAMAQCFICSAWSSCQEPRLVTSSADTSCTSAG